MKKRVLFVSTMMLLMGVFLSLTTGCYIGPAELIESSRLPSVTVSAEVELRSFPNVGFSAIKIGQGFELQLKQGNTFSVSVLANREVFPHLVLSQSEQTLEIKVQAKLSGSPRLRAAITLPHLTSLTLSSGVKAYATNFKELETLDVTLTGGSKLSGNFALSQASLTLSGASQYTGRITKARLLTFKLSGGALVTVEGDTQAANLEASAGSKLEMKALRTGQVQADLSGGSQALVRVSERLDAKLSGGAVLRWLGQATLGQIDTSGGAKVERSEP